MLPRESVERFANEWIAGWNAGDLNAIMSHYSEDVVFSSPLIVRRLGRSSGRIDGAKELRQYFHAALVDVGKPVFSISSIAVGTDAFVINYANQRGHNVAEVFYPNEDMIIQRVSVCWI